MSLENAFVKDLEKVIDDYTWDCINAHDKTISKDHSDKLTLIKRGVPKLLSVVIPKLIGIKVNGSDADDLKGDRIASTFVDWVKLSADSYIELMESVSLHSALNDLNDTLE